MFVANKLRFGTLCIDILHLSSKFKLLAQTSLLKKKKIIEFQKCMCFQFVLQFLIKKKLFSLSFNCFLSSIKNKWLNCWKY